MSTYSANVGLVEHYISPIIGTMKISEINTRVMEKYYQQLLKTKPVEPTVGKKKNEFLTPHTVRSIHKLRHSSITYKLKLNGGDVKAVQGDSGHAQVKMVTDVYSHILDDDRRNNARLFEEAFYSGAGKDPIKQDPEPQQEAAPAADVSPDTATLLKLLQNPEMAALLKTLAKSL